MRLNRCGLQIFKVNAPNVTSKVMDSEAIIIDLSTGIYFSLEGAGGAHQSPPFRSMRANPVGV